MDNTLIYIKMCEKAREIQKHNPWHGDYYCLNGKCAIYQNGMIYTQYNDGRWWSLDNANDEDSVYLTPTNIVWLPRQDQLQEMILIDELSVFDLSRKFNDFCDFEGRQEINKYISSCNSMEQLWLVFVMKEKYNKIWNDKEWIKDKKHFS